MTPEDERDPTRTVFGVSSRTFLLPRVRCQVSRIGSNPATVHSIVAVRLGRWY
jgi:hypothetical protein